MPRELRVTLVVFIGLMIIAGIGWILWRSLRRSDDPARLLFRWIITAAVLGLAGFSIHQLAGDGDAGGQIAGVLAAAVFGLILAMLWLPAIVSKVSETIGGLYTGGGEPPVPTPAYSIAEARRKQSRFKEAIYEIQCQLGRFPTDVTGQMMLAAIQAEDLRDLEAARATIDRFLAQQHAPRNIAYALNSLADWQLKLAKDVDGARAALERIVEMLPETEEARNAAQRVAHLATPEELRRREAPGPIAMREGRKDIGLVENLHLHSKLDEPPEEAVARLCGHLAEHPLDRDAREKLAQLYADEFQQLDSAIEQFDQLAQIPNQTPRDVARWLNCVADLQVRQTLDYETIRGTLQRIIDLYPDLAPGDLARQRIETLRLELKGKEKSQVVKLGSYEKDLGLKGRRPPDP